SSVVIYVNINDTIVIHLLDFVDSASLRQNIQRALNRGENYHQLRFRTEDDQQLMSPIAWQHINFYGRYEFTKGPELINVEASVEVIGKKGVMPVGDPV